MQKNLEKRGGGAWPLIPYKNFVDHVITFNSSPMQHLRWSSLWQKLLLLTVVTQSFVIIVAGFLDPTLKCTDLEQGNREFHLPLTCHSQ